MKYLLLLSALIFTRLNAQSVLNFDKRFVESEDKWVAFKPDNNGSYTYGFIYIDAQAGLTLNYEGTFKVLSGGEFIPKKLDTTNVKIRLQPTNVMVAHIPESRFNELKISKNPEWLIHYKTDTASVERLYRWGFIYNGWNECTKALSYLEKAEEIDPKYKGLAVELAYSYNCLKQYDKAEEILEEDIKNNASDSYVNKELICTLTKNNKIEKAIVQFNSSVKSLKDQQYNAENCYNILQYFHDQKDKENFQKWYKELSKHHTENKMITQFAKKMKSDLDK